MKKIDFSKKLVKILLFLNAATALFVVYMLFFKPAEPEVNVTETGGFSTIRVPEEDLKTPIYELVDESEGPLNINPNQAVCAVSVQHENVEFSDGNYNWTIKASRPDSLVSFDAGESFIRECTESSECICENAATIQNDKVCFVNLSSTESRVYINPFYINKVQPACSFQNDVAPLEMRDLNGNTRSFIELPKGEIESEEYNVSIPVNSLSFENGCMLSGVQISKVNSFLNNNCSTGKENNFLVSANSGDRVSVNTDSNGFYSIQAKEVEGNSGRYEISCYLGSGDYDSESTEYSLEIYKEDNLYESLICSDDSRPSCNVSEVTEGSTNSVLTKLLYSYNFDESGSYLLRCVSE